MTVLLSLTDPELDPDPDPDPPGRKIWFIMKYVFCSSWCSFQRRNRVTPTLAEPEREKKSLDPLQPPL